MTPKQLMTFMLLVVVALIGVTCGRSTESTPTAEPADAPVSGAVTDSQEADALRQLAFSYWEAFNAYDAEKTLGFMEESYRLQRQEEIHNEIELIELFGVRLDVSEVTPPHIVSEDEREMYLDLKEPLGTRRIRMAFRNADGEWKIIYAEEQR